MPDVMVVLAVLVAALSMAAAAALVLAARAVAPAGRVTSASRAHAAAMRIAVRAASRRGMLAALAGLVVLVVAVTVSNTLLRDLVGDAVFAAPLVAGAAGVGVYALLQAHRLSMQPSGQASLVARRATSFGQARSFVTMGLAVAALLAVETFAVVVTPEAAVFTSGAALLLVLLIGVLGAVEVAALRQIALRAALPAGLNDVDVTIRQVATRYVLLLSSSALLTTAALIAVQSGGWLFNNAAYLQQFGQGGVMAGAVVAIIGLLMAIGALAAVVAAVLSTVKHSHSVRLAAPRTEIAPA